MGNTTPHQLIYEKTPKKEINSTTSYDFKVKMPLNNKIKLKDYKLNNRAKDINLNKMNKNVSPKIITSKTKLLESYFSLQKNTSNKNKTNSCNSLTTNNNSKNFNYNKRINTTDNTKNITISEEDTIINQNSIDYINKFDIKNYKYNRHIKLKKKYLSNNKLINSKSQKINIINEENEDIINLSKLYYDKYKNKSKKNLNLFSSDSDSYNSNQKYSFNKKNRNMNKKTNNIRNFYYSHLSPKQQIGTSPIYKKASCFNLKSNINAGKMTQEKKPIYKKIKKDKNVIKLNLDENENNSIYKREKFKKRHNYNFSENNTFNKNPYYKNENIIIKNLEITKNNQQKEIILLRKKVNSLCNIIEDNKNYKDNVIKKKDKLISYLQKEKIKNENIIKKLKTELKKEKINKDIKEIKDINKSKAIYKKYTKIKKNEKDDYLKTDYILDNNNKTEVITNLIYEKKNRKYSDNLKKKDLRKSIPIKINIDLTKSQNRPFTQYKIENYLSKKRNTDLKNECKTNNNKIINNNINNMNNNLKKSDENIYYHNLNRNKSDFNQQYNKLKNNNLINTYNDKLDNIIYSKKLVFYGNNQKRRSKSITNLNSLFLKLNIKNNEIKTETKENKEIKNNQSIKETLSLNETNNLNELSNNKKEEDITMNLNLSPITENYSKNILQSIEDTSISDIFKTYNDKQMYFNINKNNFNIEKKNFVYKNKIKININDKGSRNRLFPLSPQERKNNGQNINKQKNFYYAKESFNMWNISFIILNEKLDIIVNKESLLNDVIETIINKIKENKVLNKKFSFIVENKENLIFLSNKMILDKNKTLVGNKLVNNSIIFVILEL